MARPSADVVVPFRGTAAELDELRRALRSLALNPGDSLVVVDNSPGREPAGELGEARIPVLSAATVASPGFARNRGAEGGSAEWVVFFDADTVPAPDLLERYFDPPPRERTALLAGGVLDEAVPRDGRPVARYAHIRGVMAQDNTFGMGDWSFPQTANAACRRTAFEAAGGFREDIRAGEDADLTFRLRAAGWDVERREAAAVVHRSRQKLRGFVAQKLNHGAGGAWLAERYPGAFPPRRRPGLVWWGARTLAGGLAGAARHRERDRALWAIFEPLEQLSYEFGRSLSNHDRRAGGRAHLPARRGGGRGASGPAARADGGPLSTAAPGDPEAPEQRERTVCAVVLPRPGHGGASPVLAALRAQSRAPDETVVVDQRATDVPLSGALGSGSAWLWLLDGDAVPEPRALEHLVAALDQAQALLPAPVLLTGKVLAPDGSLDPRSLPVPEVVRSDLVVGALGRRLLAVRVARRGSLLVHRRAFERPPGAAACSPLDDDLAWTAELLKHESGLLVPASIAVRTAPAWGGATSAGSEHTGACASRAELGRWLRLLSGDALAPRERAWFAFRLAELALATVRTRLSRLTGSRR